MFKTVLFPSSSTAQLDLSVVAPPCLIDLHLDALLQVLTAGDDCPELRAIFYTPIVEMEVLQHRQQLMADLAIPAQFQKILSFSNGIQKVASDLEQATNTDFPYYRHLLFIEAACEYLEHVIDCAESLAVFPSLSSPLKDFLIALAQYRESDSFVSLHSQATSLADALSQVHYTFIMEDERIVVEKDGAYQPLEQRVRGVFSPFFAEEQGDYRLRRSSQLGASHVEVEMLRCLRQIKPEIFDMLEEFYSSMKGFLPDWIDRFAREIMIFLRTQQLCNDLKNSDLSWVLPTFSDGASEEVEGCYDLALSFKGADKVVTNDYYRSKGEQIIVVSGPNQGGKTTFARTLGQLHYLAQLGLPVPARRATLQQIDGIYTHFERQERLEGQHGKLEEELVRLNQTLGSSHSNSLLIFNEILNSTMSSDALKLSHRIMDSILKMGCFVVWVTFLDELSTYAAAVVSMGSIIDSQEPEKRSYKIIRKPADSLLYAHVLAEKYSLSYAQIGERL